MAEAAGRRAMRAIVQDGSGSPDVLKLREIERPIPGDNDVLVRVRAASVNALDCHLLKMPLPIRRLLARGQRVLIPGVDLAGHVEAVGRKVTRFKAGDEVFGTGRGAFAEFASAPEKGVVAKPGGLSFAQAAALPVAGLTALQGLRDKARVRPGQRMLIHGAGGGVGTFAVQIAKTLGAHVTAVTSTRNLDVVSALHPDQIIDYTREDFVRRGEKYDVVFDVAATRPIRDLLGVLVPNGALVLVGAPKEGGFGKMLLSMIGSVVTSFFTSQRVVMLMAKGRPDDLVTLAELVVAGKISPAIERAYALSEVPDAIRYATAGQARAKLVINIDG